MLVMWEIFKYNRKIFLELILATNHFITYSEKITSNPNKAVPDMDNNRDIMHSAISNQVFFWSSSNKRIHNRGRINSAKCAGSLKIDACRTLEPRTTRKSSPPIAMGRKRRIPLIL